MKYCKRCVQPNTRPGIEFNKEGICPPCQYMDKFRDIDWKARKEKLKEIIEFGKKKNVSGYDCIIGVSGGKDSTRQSLYVRDELGLKPLLVCCSYPPEQLTERGAHNLANLISLGFDTISVSPAPQTWKKLMRIGFLRFGNWARSTEMALYACVPRVAIAYHIPLIFLGENPAIQLGDLGVGSLTWIANKMKHSNTIEGGPDSLLKKKDNISDQELIWYRYPSDDEMEWAKLEIVYLGYFWKDFNKVDNAKVSISNGLEIRDDIPENVGAIHPFEALDDDFVIVNQMMKYLKFGFGKVTDETCEELRLGRIDRKKAIELVKRYDGKCNIRYIKNFCKYIDIKVDEFWKVAESFRNKEIWEKDKAGRWKLKVELN